MARVTAVALVALVAAVGAVGAVVASSSSSSSSFDYTMYVSRWPSVASYSPQPSFVDTFVLHGLWPSYTSSSRYPEYCHEYKFSFSPIDDLVSAINVAWPDLKNPGSSNASWLWTHEYEKHGTCLCDSMDSSSSSQCERSFFELALAMHNATRTRAAFAAAQIFPSYDTQHSLATINSTLYSMFNRQAAFTCQHCSAGSDCLDRVIFCLAPVTPVNNMLPVIDCPASLVYDNINSCPSSGEQIYWPPLKFMNDADADADKPRIVVNGDRF